MADALFQFEHCGEAMFRQSLRLGHGKRGGAVLRHRSESAPESYASSTGCATLASLARRADEQDGLAAEEVAICPPRQADALSSTILDMSLTGPLHHAEQALANRADADEIEDIALKRSQRVAEIKPAIEQCRHAHGHHDPGGASFEQLLRRSPLLIFEAKAWPHELFEKRFH